MTRARHLFVRARLFGAALAVALTGAPSVAHTQELRGSRASMDLQEEQARLHNFTYLRSAEHVREFVANGFLVPMRGNAHYEIHGISFPYARPEVQLFVDRLAGQYRTACGEKLVVTSLTRPLSRQPANASDRSVHPTGMAVDLRIPRNTKCRSWLEKVLVSLEANGVIEATRENRPPHYHIAVFPRPYTRYVASLGGSGTGTGATGTPSVRTASTGSASSSSAGSVQDYRVRRGDSLWAIARTHGTSVDELVAANELQGRKIFAGQVLRVPVANR